MVEDWRAAVQREWAFAARNPCQIPVGLRRGQRRAGDARNARQVEAPRAEIVAGSLKVVEFNEAGRRE
jgi:hypothetical protein